MCPKSADNQKRGAFLKGNKLRQRITALALVLGILMQSSPAVLFSASAAGSSTAAGEVLSETENENKADAVKDESDANETPQPSAEVQTEGSADVMVQETENAEFPKEETIADPQEEQESEGKTESESLVQESQKDEINDDILKEQLCDDQAEKPQQSDAQKIDAEAENVLSEEEENTLQPTAEGVVQITSAEQLTAEIPQGSVYVLANDIVMGQDQQIGLVAGVLDGAGHTITLNGRALVMELTGTIQNLIVNGKASMQEGQASIACKVNGGTIQNCGSTVAMDPGFAFRLGGLAGSMENGKIYNSYFAGTGKDSFGLDVHYGIFCVSNNSAAPSKIMNCYYASGSGVGSGSAWNRDDANSGKKSQEDMKKADFVTLLNASNVGSGYVWAAQEGDFPKLVPGGGELEPCDKSGLKEAIEQAQSKNESDYTKESWALMQDALKKAQGVYEKIDASQAQADEAEKALREAVEALKEKVRELAPVQLPQSGVIAVSGKEDFAQIQNGTAESFYQLTQDIVLEDGFLPPVLTGVFDGNGHTITIRTPNPVFSIISETGVVQNLHVKVDGNFTNRQEFAPFAERLKGGMIVNCISEVTGQHSAGYVRKMEDGVLVNCLTMGHNRRGAFVHFQKSTDHQNSNGYKKGKFYHCYWSASNSVENILPSENLVNCEAAGDEKLRSAEFIALLNSQKGEFGVSWGRDADGYPYFGKDQGDSIIDGSDNRYDVQFVRHDDQVIRVENGVLMLSPQMTDNGRFAGRFQLESIPKNSTVTWSCEDRSNQEIMQINENGELYVFHDGGGIVRAVEHKADGTQELAAQIRVVSASRTVKELKLLLEGKEIRESAVVQGSAVNKLEIEAKYEDSTEFEKMPTYLVELKSENPEILRTDYNTAEFYFKKPGTSRLTVTEKTKKENPVSVTVSVTSEYVPVSQVKPAINGIMEIHYRNSMGSGQFISIPQTVFVEPSNASYKDDVTVVSSDVSIAQYDGSGYIPYKNGEVTFTAKINDNGKTVEGSSKVSFVYKNPLSEVSATEKNIVLEQGEKQTLPLEFHGQPGNRHEITEPDLIWTFDKKGIVSIQRPDALMQVRNTGGPDDGNWVASRTFEVKGLKAGTVVATGTPVDATGGAKPVKLTITVKGGSEVPSFDIPQFITKGKDTAAEYLQTHNSFTFREEWNIYTLLRAGIALPQEMLDSYYDDVVTNVRSWNDRILATEAERTAMALNIMGKDITDVGGINLVKIICDHPNLTKQGSNALAWALIALDMNNTPIPNGMKWSRERMVTELLSYQNEDGGFGLDKTGMSGIDMTAMSLQALARYRNQKQVASAIERGVRYLASAAQANLNLGNSESISQVIITLAVLNMDVTQTPGFGDEMDNIVSALSEYMVESQGFKHDKKGGVDKMATVQAMQALCAYERFLNGESSYWDLQGTGPVEDAAEKVSSMIEALPQEIRISDAQAVQAARDAYKALTEEEKARVKNLDKLIKAEQSLAEMQNVQQMIDKLPDVVALSDAYIVQQTRKAYDQLTDAQKTQIRHADKLEQAEKALRGLVNVISVTEMIEELPQTITLSDQNAVLAARAAYDLLTAEQKTQVENIGKLESAEKKLQELLEEKQVQAVIDAIDKLPEAVTQKDEAAVNAARDAYEKLTQTQKAAVGNIEKLICAEKAIEDQKAAAKVEMMIRELPQTVSISDRQAVQAARSAYEALNAEQKKLVNNLEKLITAEEKLKDLDAAHQVMGMIKDLPTEITWEDVENVDAVRTAYEALTEKQKEFVLNLYILERAEQTAKELKEIKKVEKAIDALPKNIAKEDAQAIKAARDAYNQLSPEQRKQVGNLEILIKAEKALKELLRPQRKPAASSQVVSNIVKADITSGMVSAKQLKEIKGKDLILRIAGKTESGESYELLLHGKDIAHTQDFCMEISRKGYHEEEIRRLSQEAEIFSFRENAVLPGPMLLQIDTALPEGEYLLLRYDSFEQRAVFVNRVQAENGRVRFVLEESGEYFLAKKASKKSIPELDAAEKQKEQTREENSKPQTETAAVQADAKPEHSEQSSKSFVVWAAIPAVILIAGTVWVKKKKENKGE